MEKLVAGATAWPVAEAERPRDNRRPPAMVTRLDAAPETLRGPIRGGQRRPSPHSATALAGNIGYLVRDVHRAFSRALQARIAAHGVSMGQWFFLRALWDEDGLTQRELSQRVGMMEPTTVTALNGMERRGLVERVRNAHDRRKVNIFLTPKGRELREVLLPCSVEVNDQAILGVNPGDLERALTVLLCVAHNLSNATPVESLLDEAEHELTLAE